MNTRACPISPETAARAHGAGISLYRCQMLAHNLASAVDALCRPRAERAPADHLAAYLHLGWLRRDGARLVLTLSGEHVRRHMAPRRAFAAA